MKPIETFSVVPSLPAAVEPLREIAFNLRWSWNHETIELFRRLDRDLWETTGHNPVLMLGRIEQEKLERAAHDDAFLAHMRRVAAELGAYIDSEPHWFGKLCQRDEKPCIAYFSAEFGLTECLSIFAGGLGILAGDHLKSSSDLGLPLTGVGLLYQQGYFRQYLNQAGYQQEAYESNDFHNLPVSPVYENGGRQVRISLEFPGRRLYAQLWRVQVGRVTLYLLDTNIDDNHDAADRDITDQLYGGDRETRIRQEIVLGIGGYRALRALGIEPTVLHMNEGHSAFLALEHIRHLMSTQNMAFAEAAQLASASLVFTTHTPVAAGHDYFGPELIERYFSDYARQLGLSLRDFTALGQASGRGDFCMTTLALRLASRANGVSKLHGKVSREMWQPLWPGVPTAEIPIGHVTNGVHFRSWISLEMNQLYDRYLAPQWREEPAKSDVWERVHSIPSEELWRTHERRREHMISWARRRLRDQRIRRGAPLQEVESASEALDPDTLTIGFARRFATYKRATLILRDMDRFRRLVLDPRRPIQLIFAGKAHPRDEAGKELIRQIKAVAHDPELARRVVFLEDYDMAVARYLVQGVDVWLNNPLRPNEASGTSGMKAAANGVLNLSVPDGWWDEVWNQPGAQYPGIGWAIGRGEQYDDPNYQDQVEAEALYEVLEHDVVPTFYDRGLDRLPRKWIERMKQSIATLCPFVNTHRMVSDYMCEHYFKAHDRFRALEAGNGVRARDLAAWVERVRREWTAVRIERVERKSGDSLLVGTDIRVRARVRLGSLTPADVAVELYVGRLDSAGEIIDGQSLPMNHSVMADGGSWLFEAVAPCTLSGLHGFTVRVRPDHPDLARPFLPGLIVWADSNVADRAIP